MAKFVIQGGKPLSGHIHAAANKNAVLPMMAACLLTDEQCTLRNVPDIADVRTMAEILRELGGVVERTDDKELQISCASITAFEPSAHLVERLRASIVLMGPLLARFGQATMHHPGGDAIGTRSIATHLAAFEALGVRFEVNDNRYHGQADQKRKDHSIFLDEASVTATENVMLFAALQPSVTIIRNAASEPHIENLGEQLRAMGASIEGLGSNVIRIEGLTRLRGTDATIAPDHIEAGTFAALAASCGGPLVIHNVVAKHLDMVLLILERMGVAFSLQDDALHVQPSELRGLSKIQTGIWPAFPTDLASIFIVLATQAQGMTLVHDWMYESRMFFVDKLVLMGANVVLADPHRVVVAGVSSLRGREFVSPDIRAGIALVMASLIANGESVIDHIELIDRGYERIDERLRSLGAVIERVQ